MELTPEQLEDISVRRQKFIDGYGQLREECQFDFVSFPQYVPSECGTFETIVTVDVADLKYTSVKSPIVIEK